jgi:N-methylhydantoinase B
VLINGAVIDTRRPHVIEPGDEVILRTPGGGGYGPEAERGAALLDYDRLHGYA